MRCKNCETIVPEGASFCTVCGCSEFESEKQVPEKSTPVCQRCGTPLQTNGAFCSNCENIIQQQQPKIVVDSSAEKPKKRSKGLIITLIVLIILLFAAAGVAGYMIWSNNNEQSNSAETQSSDEKENAESQGFVVDEDETDNTDDEEDFDGEGYKDDEDDRYTYDDEDDSEEQSHRYDDESEDEARTETERTDTQDDKKSKKTISTYTPHKTDMTWTEAKSKAISEGGHLVYINNSDEFVKVCNLADSNDIKVFWVGARRYTDDWSDATWLDGKRITYTKWLSGEPSYSSEDGEEIYLMVFKVNGEWYYNDAANDAAKYYSGKMGYIVEKEEEI